jgi:hypothetical protein
MKNLCCGQKALIGAGIIGLMLLLRNSKVAGVGKIRDYGPSGNGRIDHYWGNLDVNKKL